jgi:hypothetical protein
MGGQRMRQTIDIVADVMDGKKVQYDELEATCRVLAHSCYFFKVTIRNLLDPKTAEVCKMMEFSDLKTSSVKLGIPSWYWVAMRTDPEKWLGIKATEDDDDEKQPDVGTAGGLF